MSLKHSFFICDEENCTDKQKLINLLATKSQKNLECIFCDYVKHRSFKNFQDVQKHMVDLGHCMMNPGYLHDYDDLYDYSEENMEYIKKYMVEGSEGGNANDYLEFEVVDEKGKKIRKPKTDDNEDEWVNISEEEENEDQEVAEGDLVIKEEKQTENFTEKNGRIKISGNLIDPKKKYNLRKFMVRKARINHIGELILPNNKLLGTKKYRIYYNQRYRDNEFQRMHLIKALEARKIIDRSTDVMVRYDLQELRKIYNSTIAIDDKNRLDKTKKLNQQLQKEDQEYRRLFINRNLKKDKRHNLTLSKHYRDRNLLTC